MNDTVTPLRLAAVEARLEAIERWMAEADGGHRAPHAPDGSGSVDGEIFWALSRLKAELPSPGGVLFTGAVELPTGVTAEWQLAAATTTLLDRDWDGFAPVLSALAHPVRLSLLQVIARGSTTVSALAALDGFGTTGQIYHHINQLVAAGWLESSARGLYAIPVAKIVPLLVILTAVGLY